MTTDNLGLPVALSLALHGLAVVALGVFSPATTVAPIQSAAITVDLATLPQAVTVHPAPAPFEPAVKPTVTQAAAPKARSAVVKRASSRARARVAARVRPVATPVASAMVSPSHMALSEPVTEASEESLTAMALQSALASVTSSDVVFARAGTFVLSEAGGARSKVRLRHNPRPEYPRRAREAGWAGTVILQVVVLPNGTAGNVTLHTTSGHAILDEAARSAVQRWQFVPAMDGNVSFESVVSLPIRFDLQDAY